MLFVMLFAVADIVASAVDDEERFSLFMCGVTVTKLQLRTRPDEK